jgi:hypothetical protein
MLLTIRIICFTIGGDKVKKHKNRSNVTVFIIYSSALSASASENGEK